MLISAGYSRPNVEENVDLLEMAPEGVGAVDKMKTYSTEFEAGQPGFLLIDADVSASPEIFNTNFDGNDPYSKLVGIEELEGKCNQVNQTTAVSIVFLMKAIAVGVDLDGDPINEPIQNKFNQSFNYYIYENILKLDFGKLKQDTKSYNNNGNLNLVHGTRMFLSQAIYNIEPKVGDFYFFPNYLMHTVFPFKDTDEERRCNSFNCKIDDALYNIHVS